MNTKNFQGLSDKVIRTEGIYPLSRCIERKSIQAKVLHIFFSVLFAKQSKWVSFSEINAWGFQGQFNVSAFLVGKEETQLFDKGISLKQLPFNYTMVFLTINSFHFFKKFPVSLKLCNLKGKDSTWKMPSENWRFFTENFFCWEALGFEMFCLVKFFFFW